MNKKSINKLQEMLMLLQQEDLAMMLFQTDFLHPAGKNIDDVIRDIIESSSFFSNDHYSMQVNPLNNLIVCSSFHWVSRSGCGNFICVGQDPLILTVLLFVDTSQDQKRVLIQTQETTIYAYSMSMVICRLRHLTPIGMLSD